MRVLLVDDHWIVRLGLRSLLEQTADIKVVGEASDATEAVSLTEELNPDLVILDLTLRGPTTGVEACREIKMLLKPPLVLIHTASNTADDMAAAMLAGADGYVHKGLERIELTAVTRRVCSGEHIWLLTIEPAEAEKRLQEAASDARLTPREREVFALLVRRYSNREIAQKLYTSVYTTKNQVSSVLRKLGVDSRSQLFGAP